MLESLGLVDNTKIDPHHSNISVGAEITDEKLRMPVVTLLFLVFTKQHFCCTIVLAAVGDSVALGDTGPSPT